MKIQVLINGISTIEMEPPGDCTIEDALVLLASKLDALGMHRKPTMSQTMSQTALGAAFTSFLQPLGKVK